MFKATSNTAKNRLYIKLSGSPSQNELIKFRKKCETEIKLLKEGFTVLSDLSGYVSSDDKFGVPSVFLEVMNTIKSGKPSKIARIVKAKSTIEEFDRAARQVFKNTRTIVRNFEDEASAEKFLSEKPLNDSAKNNAKSNNGTK